MQTGVAGHALQTSQLEGHASERNGFHMAPLYWPPTLEYPMSDRRFLPVPGLDPVAAARWRGRVLPASPWLHEEVAARMMDRLDWIREAPQSWVHWSPLLGGQQAHQHLAARYPSAQLWLAGEQAAHASLALRPVPASGWAAWKARLGGRAAEALPVWQPGTSAPVDMLWANMALHLHAEPATLLAQWLDMLRVDGFLMFSALGPDSFRELRQVHERQGWPAPMHPLTDMHDWGDMMVELGWAEPVVDMERLTLTYPDAARMLDDLRAWGRNLATERFSALRGRGYRAAWLAAVERHAPRTPEGQLQLTVELVYGHAFRARPRLGGGGEQAVSLDDMRAMLRKSPR